MANTLGALIGKIAHSFSVKNHAGDTASVRTTYDCSQMTDAEIKSALASHLAIRQQRVARLLSVDEIMASYDGVTILAGDVGKKIKSAAERHAELVNTFTSAGIDETTANSMADTLVNDPAKLADAYKTITE